MNGEPSGFIALCKPAGMTSHDLVAWGKRAWGAAKVGHCGTLDPLAVGTLVLCVNKATKSAERLAGSDKRYRAEIRFGASTDTGDAAGKLKETGPKTVDRQTLEAALPRFVGEIRQKPPMASAVKVGGKKLYKLSHKGLEVERPERTVFVHSIRLEAFYDEADGTRALVDVACGKGVYIRALAEDIGAAVGSPAHLSFLSRTAVGPFLLEEAAEPDAVADREKLEARIWTIEKTLAGLNA